MTDTPSRRPILRCVVALALPLAIWLATMGLMSFHPSRGNIDVAAGRSTFRDHCGACHILESGYATHHGPNLHDIGAAASSRRPGRSAAQYILESILDPDAFVAAINRKGMPKNVAADLSPDDIRNIVAFLASRGASPDYGEISRLDIPDMRRHRAEPLAVRRQDMELAERVVRDKGTCLQCHSVHRNAEYQVFAPALFGVGLIDRERVRESIVDPQKVVMPGFHTANVFLNSGKVVTGRLISQSDEGLILFTRDNERRAVRTEIPWSDVEEDEGKPLIRESETSEMPTGFDKLLTGEELEAVLTMIEQLN